MADTTTSPKPRARGARSAKPAPKAKPVKKEAEQPEEQPAKMVPAVVAPQQQPATLSLDDVTGQVELIQRVMRTVMHDGEHYGVIPGTNG